MKQLSIKQKRIFTIFALVLLIAMLAAPGALAGDPKGAPTPVRFASFNASLNRFNAGDLATELSLIDKRGSFYSYGDIRLGQGRENAKSFLRENPDMMAEIDLAIRQQTLSGLMPMALDEDEELEPAEEE